MATDPTTKQGDPPAPVELRIVSDPKYLVGARELVANVCKRVGFTDDAAGKVALALDEALANIIRHGYDRKLDRPIWISVWPESDPGIPGVRIQIEDEAKQIDPDNIKGRDLDEIRPGGLGVYIMRRVMDHVHFEKRASKGMRLTMTRAAATVDQPESSQSA